MLRFATEDNLELIMLKAKTVIIQIGPAIVDKSEGGFCICSRYFMFSVDFWYSLPGFLPQNIGTNLSW